MSDSEEQESTVVEEETSEITGKKGIIYRLFCDHGNFYIGSTQRSLRTRLRDHMSSKNRTRKIYSHFNEDGWDKVYVEVTKTVHTITRQALYLIEHEEVRKHIGTPLCLNQVMVRPSREETEKKLRDWHVANADHTREWMQRYYVEHRQEMREQHRKYYASNLEYTRARHREYAQATKEYYTERIPCLVCGKNISRSNMRVHKKTQTCSAIALAKEQTGSVA